MFYNLVSDSNGKTLTLIFTDGDTIPVSEDHPRYEEIFEAVQEDALSEDEIRDMANLVAQVGDRLHGLSERVSVRGNTVLFDGDPLHNSISSHILRLLQAGDVTGWTALVNFLEKAQTNPNEHSRDSLFSWINERNFTITRDGDLIAYKGVLVDEEGISRSVHSGTATVNGVVHVGKIPNPNGAVVEMPRSEVQHDTEIGCSTGLHAGTWEYASKFGGGRTLTVRINPRDVVSVPTDCNAQKMRVSRYEVIDTVDAQIDAPTYDEGVDDDEEPEETFCEACGYPEEELDLSIDGLCESCEAEYEEENYPEPTEDEYVVGDEEGEESYRYDEEGEESYRYDGPYYF